jgi:hypothetical protein
MWIKIWPFWLLTLALKNWDEPVWVAIHMCMETTLGIFLYSYLYLKLTETLCLSHLLLCFLFKKIGEQEGDQVLPGRGWRGGPKNVYMWVNVKIKQTDLLKIMDFSKSLYGKMFYIILVACKNTNNSLGQLTWNLYK